MSGASGDVAPLTCQQIVFAEDDCCRDQVCAKPAAWRHEPTGLALCETHEANARRWSSGGVWRVGTQEVSYPEGWQRLEPEPDAHAPDATDERAPALERVEVGGGLAVERDPLG